MIEELLPQERTILFFYGANPKQMFIYSPDMYSSCTPLVQIPAEGAGAPGRKQQQVSTGLAVASYTAIDDVNKTDCTHATAGSHLYIAVMSLRSQSIFDDPVLQSYLEGAKSSGNIFASKLTISQYLTAPMITPEGTIRVLKFAG